MCVLAFALAGAQLTKGPVGLLLPLLTVLTFCWMPRRTGLISAGASRSLSLAVAVSLGAFMLWAYPANEATGGEFLRMGIGHHTLKLTVSPLEQHGGHFLLFLPYYLPVVLGGFLPWTLFLPAGVSALVGNRMKTDRSRNFLLAWIMPTLLLMTLVATKLPHYILPAFPALALLVAWTIKAAEEERLDRISESWLRRGCWFMGPISAGIGLSAMILPWFVPLTGVRGPLFGVGLLLLMVTFLGLRENHSRRYRVAAVTLFAGMLLLQASIAGLLLPAFERIKVSVPIARAINAQIPSNVPIVTYKYDEPSLICYLDRPSIAALHSEMALASWIQVNQPGVLVIPESRLNHIKTLYGTSHLLEIASAEGYNYSKGNFLKLLALRRQ